MDHHGDKVVLSSSIEETNALRLKLGLKPLAVRDSIATENDGSVTAQAKVSAEEPKTDESVAARRRLIEGAGLADLLAKGEHLEPLGSTKDAGEGDDEGDDAYRTLDVKAWSRRMAAIARRSQGGILNYSDDEDEAVPPPKAQPKARSVPSAKLKVLHKVDELPLDSGKEVVLNLADVGVLEAEAAGIGEVNFLEHPDLAPRGGIKSAVGGPDPGDYNPYDDDEGGEALVEGKPNILSKYDRAVEEYQGASLSNLASGKRGFYVKLAEEGEPEAKRPETLVTRPIEETIDFGGLQRKKDLLKNRQRPVNWDKVFGSKGAGADAPAPALPEEDTQSSQIVKRATIDLDDVEECNHLYSQLSKHRNRVLSRIKEEPLPAAAEPARTSVIDTGALDSGAAGLQINATSELIKAVQPKYASEERVTSRKRAGAPAESTQEAPTATDAADDAPAAGELDGGVDNNAPMTTGIAAALAYLKDKGDLIEARRDLSNVGKDIALHYIDEYGRRMTPKEAFRKMSWRFHGKGPGLNKQERKIKRLERERLSMQNPVENLPTMKALMTRQAETKSSYLVLSGNTPGVHRLQHAGHRGRRGGAAPDGHALDVVVEDLVLGDLLADEVVEVARLQDALPEALLRVLLLQDEPLVERADGGVLREQRPPELGVVAVEALAVDELVGGRDRDEAVELGGRLGLLERRDEVHAVVAPEVLRGDDALPGAVRRLDQLLVEVGDVIVGLQQPLPLSVQGGRRVLLRRGGGRGGNGAVLRLRQRLWRGRNRLLRLRGRGFCGDEAAEPL
ncbi:SART-1 family protein [Babesia caballi]|uniref:SART-1 family protein n=1 Tax=Babesia caballi TaxID=5871 RepID=A0AAV4LNI8_BABCB|nr:SART-1 family protein [Babesia caballi]